MLPTRRVYELVLTIAHGVSALLTMLAVELTL